MHVLKFGGTSVANAENIKRVIEILREKSVQGPVITVVSALGGMTDTLQRCGELANEKDDHYLDLFSSITERHITAANDLGLEAKAISSVETQLDKLKEILHGVYLINEFSNKTRDKVLSFGELLSSYIISEALGAQVPGVALKDSRELIITNSNHTQALVDITLTDQNISTYFAEENNKLTVVPGFVARNETGETTTLGRGGSDYTAAILAAALDAAELEIWTDVSGMYTANPKLVPQAFPIPEISYQEAMELSHFGAKVLYPPTIRPVLDKHIPIRVKNTFEPQDPGTLIHDRVEAGAYTVKGISHLPDIALLTLEGSGMVGIPGFSKRLFEALSIRAVNVILITQASSEHSICIGIQAKDSELAREAVNGEFAFEISLGKIDPVTVEMNLAIIAAIGDNMKSHQGISGKMFSSLGKNNV
ncbi:MAG: aspartate kinase, partial [Bacteroidia bacterium]|nr:aspartate kinase [Bacteroidia bacterium]